MPEGKNILFQKYVGMCEGMPYLDISGNHDACVMIQTLCDKFGIFTDKQAEKAIDSRDM